MNKLSNQISDQNKVIESLNKRNLPFTIKNFLPNDLDVYVKKVGVNGLYPVGKVETNKTYSLAPNFFNNGDMIYAFLGSKQFLFSENVVNTNRKNISLGTVTYSSNGRSRETTTSFSDIAGVTIHNKTLLPLNIIFRGAIVAQLYGHDGMSQIGGSSSTFYFDNNRSGLNVGDQISFSYASPTNQKNIFSVSINDNHITDLYVGDIKYDISLHKNDTYAYRVDSNVISGIKYYHPPTF